MRGLLLSWSQIRREYKHTHVHPSAPKTRLPQHSNMYIALFTISAVTMLHLKNIMDLCQTNCRPPQPHETMPSGYRY